jgi:hypothetical protein
MSTARLGARALGLLSCLAGLLAADCPPDNAGTIVVFGFRYDPTLELRVLIEDSATVASARSFIANGQGPHIPIGRIRRGKGVDSRYPFHFVPGDVRLAELAAEVCDARLMRTPAQVDSFIAGAGDRYCPWSAYPKRIE